jgi:hypothetical protein
MVHMMPLSTEHSGHVFSCFNVLNVCVVTVATTSEKLFILQRAQGKGFHTGEKITIINV